MPLPLRIPPPWPDGAGVTGTLNPIQRRRSKVKEEQIHAASPSLLYVEIYRLADGHMFTVTCLQSSSIFRGNPGNKQRLVMASQIRGGVYFILTVKSKRQVWNLPCGYKTRATLLKKTQEKLFLLLKHECKRVFTAVRRVKISTINWNNGRRGLKAGASNAVPDLTKSTLDTDAGFRWKNKL